MKQNIIRLLMTAALVAGGLGIVSTPAQAASCSGSITDVFNAPDGSGQLVIFYSSASGGTNTACMIHLGSYYGKAAPTSVRIGRCTTNSGPEGAGCTVDKWSSWDSGNYKYYAGPRSVTGAAHRCVVAEGSMRLRNGSTWSLSSGRQGCGG